MAPVKLPKEPDLADQFAAQLRQAGVGSGFVREHRFHATRRWRFDLAWPELMLAVEADGGTWTGGGHVRGRHFESDCEKLNEAALAGWRVLRVTTDMVEDGRAIAYVERALEVKERT